MFITNGYRRDARDNDAMKKPRVNIENCLGLLKARFPFLINLQFTIKGADNGKEYMRKICKYVKAAVILHNLLTKRDDVVPQEWIHKDDALSNITDNDGFCSVAELEELRKAVPLAAPNGERRKQLCRYMNTK